MKPDLKSNVANEYSIKKDYDVIVVGAGPAGLMAAISASRGGKDVLVVEQKDIPLKKIYATGNGRCNFTNLTFDDKVFRGQKPEFAYEAYKRFDNKALIEFMRLIGVISKDISGYVYPYNEQARTIAQALLFECRRLHVTILCSSRVVDITKTDDRFEVTTEKKDRFECRDIIVTVGGKASPTHGSDGNLNKVIRRLGHEIILQRPALVPLTFEDKKFSDLSGVRLKCKATLLIDGEKTEDETGEIIFNKDNISGIPVMQLSRYATKALDEKKSVSLKLDLFPDMEEAELCKLINNADKDMSVSEAFGLLTNEKMAQLIVSLCGLENKRVCEASEKINKAVAMLKGINVKINGDCGFNRAQVTSGGVSLDQINSDMGSKLVDGLYFAGEVLDIDGTCGGYNLQWAFTSGYIAGSAVSGLSL